MTRVHLTNQQRTHHNTFSMSPISENARMHSLVSATKGVRFGQFHPAYLLEEILTNCVERPLQLPELVCGLDL